MNGRPGGARRQRTRGGDIGNQGRRGAGIRKEKYRD